jgi:hypothetical protein
MKPEPNTKTVCAVACYLCHTTDGTRGMIRTVATAGATGGENEPTYPNHVTVHVECYCSCHEEA